MKRKLWKLVEKMALEARFAFYAGLIDAEGHIDPVHMAVDIFQSDKDFIDNLAKQLLKDGFVIRAAERFVRIYIGKYYESNLVLINKIVPYLKHSEKIETLPNILSGNLVKKSYSLIVKWISLFPNKTTSEITLKFGQNENYFCYQKLTQLVKQKLIKRYKTERKGKFRYKATEKGITWLQLNKQFIEEKLREIIINKRANCGMYSYDSEAIREILKEHPLPVYSPSQDYHNS